jgi:hypothetical protein
MTDDDRVLRLLGDVLDRQPTSAPDRLLTTVLDKLQTAPQRGRWFLPNWRDLLTAPSLARLAIGGLVAAVIAVAMFQLTPRSALVGPGATSTSSPTIAPSTVASPSSTPALTAGSSPSTTPVPTDAASPLSTTTPSASDVAPIAIEGVGNLVTGTTYTSRLFEPTVTFKLATRDGAEDTTGETTDWCPTTDTSADRVVLSHPLICADSLTIFHPYAVECGTPDSHPDAATLAAAVLAHPAMTGARDLGDLQSGGKVPSNLFRVDQLGVAYPGRIIQLFDQVTPEPSAGDPDHCRLLARPGTGTRAIDIRSGQAARLIFIDTEQGLVVVKVASGLTLQAHLLSRIYDIQFGPTPPPDPSTSPVPYPTVISHLPDGVEVEIPTGFTMHFTPREVEQMTLARIALDEQRLGRVLLPAHVLKIAVVPAGTVYWPTRRDGTNPNQSGFGPDRGPGWVVVAEGTFVGLNRQTNTIDSHGTLGYFGFDDMDNGGESRIFIPCWFASPVPPDQLEGSCP